MATDSTARSESALQGRTPGPWVARQYCGDDDNWFVRGPDDEAVCGQGSGQVRGANARAIAATPLLIAALVEAKREMWLSARAQWTMADFKNWAVIQQIDAALDAARGVS